MESSPLFARTFDFLSWLLPRTESFPRAQRFAVTQRLQGAALDFQEMIVEAETLRGSARIERLRMADASLGKVRLYLRLCREWRWLTSGQYEHAARMISEIGRLLGGWMKVTGVQTRGEYCCAISRHGAESMVTGLCAAVPSTIIPGTCVAPTATTTIPTIATTTPGFG
jgi:four helix bundle protein